MTESHSKDAKSLLTQDEERSTQLRKISRLGRMILVALWIVLVLLVVMSAGAAVTVLVSPSANGPSAFLADPPRGP